MIPTLEPGTAALGVLLLARTAGAVLVPWALLGLRRGWPWAALIGLVLLTSGALPVTALPPGISPPLELKTELLLGQAALGLALGGCLALPLLALQVLGRVGGAGLVPAARAPGEVGASHLPLVLVLIGVILFFELGAHHPALDLWLLASRTPYLFFTLPGEELALAAGDALAAGLLAGLPLLMLAGLGSILARWVEQRLATAGVDALGQLAPALVLLGLGLWLAAGLPGLQLLFERSLLLLRLVLPAPGSF